MKIQQEALDKKKKYLWDCVPDTELVSCTCKGVTWKYIILQKKILWETLCSQNVRDFTREELLELRSLVYKSLVYTLKEADGIGVIGGPPYNSRIVNAIVKFVNPYCATNIITDADRHFRMIDNISTIKDFTTTKKIRRIIFTTNFLIRINLLMLCKQFKK